MRKTIVLAAFGGKTSYTWSDRNGTLFATWERRAAALAPR